MEAARPSRRVRPSPTTIGGGMTKSISFECSTKLPTRPLSLVMSCREEEGSSIIPTIPTAVPRSPSSRSLSQSERLRPSWLFHMLWTGAENSTTSGFYEERVHRRPHPRRGPMANYENVGVFEAPIDVHHHFRRPLPAISHRSLSTSKGHPSGSPPTPHQRRLRMKSPSASSFPNIAGHLEGSSRRGRASMGGGRKHFSSATPRTTRASIASIFTAGVGRPGQAKETREAVSKLMHSVYPSRPPPIAPPLDHEKFLIEKGAQLEHDRDRDLLLPPRDDISESLVRIKERTAVGSVRKEHLEEAQWLLTIDALQHYSDAPRSIINFNYIKFAGDFKRFDNPTQGLTPLRFESQMAVDEERMLASGQKANNTLEVIKEGYLVLLPSGDNSSFVDNFRSGKRRYCIIRRDDDLRKVFIEVLKHARLPAITTTTGSIHVVQPLMEIKCTSLKATKKGRPILQLSPSTDSDKRALVLAAEVDQELAIWQEEIERALIWQTGVEDSLSMDSASVRGGSAPPSSQVIADTESLTSEESLMSGARDPTTTATSAAGWRGRNAASKSLQPPIIDRRNIFSLYSQMDNLPLPEPETDYGDGTMTTQTLQYPTTATHKSKQPNSETPLPERRAVEVRESPFAARKGTFVPVSTTPSNPPTTTRSSSPTPSASSYDAEPPAILFVAELKGLHVRLSIGNSGGGAVTPPEQIEPFFLRCFIFDAGLGTRVSEEFHHTVLPHSRLFEEALRPHQFRQQMSTSSSTSSALGTFSNGIGRSKLLDPNATKFISRIPNPRPDIFIVVVVERVLSDSPADVYSKGSIDAKGASKMAKAIATAHTKIGRRCTFSWAAKPVFPSMNGSTTNKGSTPATSKPLQLYRCDGHLTDVDLQKLLHELSSRPEKSSKLVAIPSASLSITGEIVSTVSDLPMRISPLLLPLRPWRVPADSPLSPAFELQSMVGEALIGEPHKSMANLLYVYPTSLAYSNQKVFSKARNISCSISLRRGENNEHRAIYDRTDPTNGPLVGKHTCSVQYHEPHPQFNDEVKVQLPCSLNEHDHLLFEFKHISVANALSPKGSHEPLESPIGYSWLPLVRHSKEGHQLLVMSEDVQSFELPVSATLPPGYLKMGVGRESPLEQQPLRLVDGGKPLVKIRLQLISTVLSSDAHIQSFFQSCQRLRGTALLPFAVGEAPSAEDASVDPDPSNALLLLTTMEGMMNADIYHILPFLHIILNRLLLLITCSTSSDISLNALNALVVIIDRVAESKSRHQALRDFVGLHARCHTSTDTDETTHAALLKYIPMLLVAERDLRALSPVYRQLWFLLDCIVKMMAQWVIGNKLLKANRRDRFPIDVLVRIEGLSQCLVDQIIARHRDLPADTRSANVAWASFLKHTLSLCDRYVIMRQLHYAVERMDDSESRSMRIYKLELLQLLTGHEHWLPLNLPLLTNKYSEVMRGESSASIVAATVSTTNNDTTNGKGNFLSKFFSFSNSIIFNNHTAMQESSDADKYAEYVEHFFLSDTYCRTHFPVGLLLQELATALKDSRSYRRKVVALVRNLLAKHSQDVRYVSSSAQNRIAVLYAPIIRMAIANVKELEATAAACADSLGVQSKNPTTAFDLTNRGGGGRSSGKAMTLPSNEAAPAPIAALAEKLDRDEARDLLLCVLYLLQKMPKKTLAALWCAQQTIQNNEAHTKADQPPSAAASIAPVRTTSVHLDFIRVLELALFMFRFRGHDSHTAEREAAKRQRWSRTLVNFQPTPSEQQITMESQVSLPQHHNQNALNVVAEEETMGVADTPSTSLLLDSHLTQEVAMIVLDTAQTLATQISNRPRQFDPEIVDSCFDRLLNLELSLLGENWPEGVRMHAIASLAVFINLFSSRFFHSGPLDPLSTLIEALLLQFNNRIGRIRNMAAALLHLILRSGFDAATALTGVGVSTSNNHHSRDSQQPTTTPTPSTSTSTSSTSPSSNRLGRPGAQMGVALARLLGRKATLNSDRFEKGLVSLEALVKSSGRLSPFERAVLSLIDQLRGVLEATSALGEVKEDSCRRADLQLQLADSYRGSSELRCVWLATLSKNHIEEGWYSEAAVAQLHCIAIIGKELAMRGEVEPDWRLLDVLNEGIAGEEGVYDQRLESTQQAGYTLENFAAHIEEAVQTLVRAERYEAVGPISRLLIPIYEKQLNYKALLSLYGEIEQAFRRAMEVKAHRKRHLGSYFRIIFHGADFGAEDHKQRVEWIYREPKLTSLAEACDRMLEATRKALGHDRVEIVGGEDINGGGGGGNESDINTIQMTHVKPHREGAASSEADPMDYWLHTNISTFIYEEKVEDSAPSSPNTAEQARLSVKRIILTTQSPFPNTRRRQRVVGRSERVLTPLELACDALLEKASQIRKILHSAGIRSGAYGCFDKPSLKKVDLKHLQLCLQGAVSPSVNAGVLSYASAFTTPSQIARYGSEGIASLVGAFRVLIVELELALRVNEAAIGSERNEYRTMLRNSFEGMLERLSGFFPEEKFAVDASSNQRGNDAQGGAGGGGPRNSVLAVHILDSIGGVNS